MTPEEGRTRESSGTPGQSFSHLVVGELIRQGISGLLQQFVKAFLLVFHQRLHLHSLLLPLDAVADHSVQLLEARLHAMLGAVPLAAHLLHWGPARGPRAERDGVSNANTVCVLQRQKSSVILHLSCNVFSCRVSQIVLQWTEGCTSGVPIQCRRKIFDHHDRRRCNGALI